MIKYTSQNQLSIEEFNHPFERDLDKDNRWVKLASVLPWDSLASVYAKNLRSDRGRKSVDVRMVIAAMIVKHKLNLSDRETVETISENVYLQYFCGLKSFTIKKPFDASLFVDIRKRMGVQVFESFNDHLIEVAEKKGAFKNKRSKKAKEEDNNDSNQPRGKKEPKPKGKLKLDATIADQMIKYPTDLNLLNDSREQAERIIDVLYKVSGLQTKPRDYRRVARKQYLNVARMKRRPKNVLRKGLRQQLQYLRRDIGIIKSLLTHFSQRNSPLTKRDKEIWSVIQEIYNQQKYMYDNNIRKHPDRIVSIHQPWVRPIVRGKDKINVEFGSKINVSEFNGFCKINRLDWNAYNEAMDLVGQVEEYRRVFGYYPELVLADRIYLNRANRKYLKSKGIRIVGKPLGRPSKLQLSAYEKRKLKKERNERNHIEGKFGQGKNGYSLSKIRARLKNTSESWVAAIIFTMNITRLMKIIEGKAIFWLKSAYKNPKHDRLALSEVLLKLLFVSYLINLENIDQNKQAGQNFFKFSKA